VCPLGIPPQYLRHAKLMSRAATTRDVAAKNASLCSDLLGLTSDDVLSLGLS
jgi:hypothetical protein